MTKVPAYHTNSHEYPTKHREVYHNHDDFSEGKKIEEKHKEKGTGDKPRCKVCINLG